MTAIADKRKRSTWIGLVGTVLLVVAAASMFVVGVVTLSNSEEGEAVGVDLRPIVALPATPNALLAVTDADGGLESLVVTTLLPAGVGGSIVVIPPNADATASFGSQRRPLDQVFAADSADLEAFTATVQEMLSITIERSQVVSSAELGDLISAAAGDTFVVDPERLVDDQVWAELAEAAPVSDAAVAPVDESNQPIPPATVAELVERLMAGEVQSRALVTRVPAEGENPTDAEVVVVDRRDATLVFAQVSPALVSTPGTGSSVRIVGPFSDEQIEASDGMYESTSELMLDVIGEMHFFQTNVVSIDTQPVAGGAAKVTLIEVAEERFIADMLTIAPIVFGESEVVLASTLIEGVDMVITLGTDYIENKAATSAGRSEEPVDTTVGTVAETTGDTVEVDD